MRKNSVLRQFLSVLVIVVSLVACKSVQSRSYVKDAKPDANGFYTADVVYQGVNSDSSPDAKFAVFLLKIYSRNSRVLDRPEKLDIWAQGFDKEISEITALNFEPVKDCQNLSLEKADMPGHYRIKCQNFGKSGSGTLMFNNGESPHGTLLLVGNVFVNGVNIGAGNTYNLSATDSINKLYQHFQKNATQVAK